MLPKIGHIVFHEQLYSMCLKVHQNYFLNHFSGVEIVQINTADENEIKTTAKQLEEKCDIIISREDTIGFLEKKLQIPIVSRSVTLSDVLDVLKNCSRKGKKKVGLICYHTQNYNLEDWPYTLGIKVNRYFYGPSKNTYQAVLEAKRDHVDIVAGSVMVGRCAKELNLDCELIGIKKNIIIQSIQNAVDILKALKKEREITVKFHSLLNFTYEGIIFLNTDHIITYANTKACQIFGMIRSRLLKKNFFKILSNFESSEHIKSLPYELTKQDNNKSFNSVFSFKGINYIFNIVNVKTSFKNIDNRYIVTILEASHLQEMEWKLRKQLSKEDLLPKFSFDDIHGKSLILKNTKDEARAYARTYSSIFIYGETGTGKELFSQSIHRASQRATGPFVALNCSAVHRDLMESELFGYVKGSFTGARATGKIGLFELAHKGTLLLDEVCTMPLDLQVKLLRVIQERKITRLGDTKEIPIDIRIIAATNESPEEAVAKGTFRSDLYYRLNVLFLKIPPLRERLEDIPILFSHFVKYFSKQLRISIKIPEPTALLLLNDYPWPGNVRELQNFSERFAVFNTIKNNSTKILEKVFNKYYGNKRLSSTKKYTVKFSSKTPDISLAEVRNDSERVLLFKIGEKVQWNRTKMCQMLDISKATLWRKMKKAGLC